MIYLEPSALTWKPLLKSYIDGELYAPLREFAKEFEILFIWLADACIDHIRHSSKVIIRLCYIFNLTNILFLLLKYIKELVPTGDSNLIKSMMCWASMLLHEHCEDAEEASKNKHLKHWLTVKFNFIYY
jgi:hypothetical protein